MEEKTMDGFGITQYAGMHLQKLRELMNRWNLSEFETAKRVVKTHYTSDFGKSVVSAGFAE